MSGWSDAQKRSWLTDFISYAKAANNVEQLSQGGRNVSQAVLKDYAAKAKKIGQIVNTTTFNSDTQTLQGPGGNWAGSGSNVGNRGSGAYGEKIFNDLGGLENIDPSKVSIAELDASIVRTTNDYLAGGIADFNAIGTAALATVAGGMAFQALGGGTVAGSGGGAGGGGGGGSVAATGNFVPAAHATSTTAVTAQTAGASQFLTSTAASGSVGSGATAALNAGKKIVKTVSRAKTAKDIVEKGLDALDTAAAVGGLTGILLGSSGNDSNTLGTEGTTDVTNADILKTDDGVAAAGDDASKAAKRARARHGRASNILAGELGKAPTANRLLLGQAA